MPKRPPDPPEPSPDPDTEPEDGDDEDARPPRRQRLSEYLQLELDVLRDIFRRREETDDDD